MLQNLAPQILPSPATVMAQLPCSPALQTQIAEQRRQIAKIVEGSDPRLLVICGPCSIHDIAAGQQFASRLAEEAYRWRHQLLCVMRYYVDKPRTRLGWRGLALQNDQNELLAADIATQLLQVRQALLQVAELGLPLATEFLEPLLSYYWQDVISWAAIGARTVESQVHRALAAAAAMPIGFKNRTDGNVAVAIDALVAARAPQPLLGIDQQGIAAAFTAAGNPHVHVVLRGGSQGSNYHPESILTTAQQLAAVDAPARILIDVSHGNSGKNYAQQAHVVTEIGAALAQTRQYLIGIMLESFLVAGRALPLVQPLFGQSITDGCLGWEETLRILQQIAGFIH